MKWSKRGTATTVKDAVLELSGIPEEEYHVTQIYKLKRAHAVCDRLQTAISEGEEITIVGDYDADGICASVIFYLAIAELGDASKVKVRLPKRFSEGYGLSEAIIDEIDTGLLITVDNGIVAVDAVKKAKEKGLSVVLTDHHLLREDGVLPPADIIVNPSAIGEADYLHYCGAGLAYKICELLPLSDSTKKKMLSLACIATVADIVPLTGDNRQIVKEGLKTLVDPSGTTTGLKALLQVCKLGENLTEKDIGFKIGPCINAAGRMSDDGASFAFEVLSFIGNEDKAYKLAVTLNDINTERKTTKEMGLIEIEDFIEKNRLFDECPICVYKPGLHEGIVGIYAGNIAEKYCKPCIVLTDAEEEGVIKGSARTHGGIHLKDLLDSVGHLLENHGGHAEAAGLSLKLSNLQVFREAINRVCPIPEEGSHFYDLAIEESQIEGCLHELSAYAPYGHAAPEVIFKISNFTPLPQGSAVYRVIGNGHLKFKGEHANALWFYGADDYASSGRAKQFHIYGYLSYNHFAGVTSPQIEVIDIQPVG